MFAANGSIDLSDSAPGVYTITYTTSGLCPDSSTQVITIAEDDASFNYSASGYCSFDTDPTPTITGLSGGVFSSSPAGLSLNTGTGEIDLSASTLGSYTVTYTTTGPCPNSTDVTVSVDSVDASVTGTSPTFTAVETGATYQWLNCDSAFAPISGETNQGFTATANGNYAVVVTLNGCSDTSVCNAVTTVGLGENAFGNSVLIYPNPTSGVLNIQMEQEYEDITVTVRNVLGQIISVQNFSKTKVLEFELEGADGYYWLEISTGTGDSTNSKILKE